MVRMLTLLLAVSLGAIGGCEREKSAKKTETVTGPGGTTTTTTTKTVESTGKNPPLNSEGDAVPKP